MHQREKLVGGQPDRSQARLHRNRVLGGDDDRVHRAVVRDRGQRIAERLEEVRKAREAARDAGEE